MPGARKGQGRCRQTSRERRRGLKTGSHTLGQTLPWKGNGGSYSERLGGTHFLLWLGSQKGAERYCKPRLHGEGLHQKLGKVVSPRGKTRHLGAGQFQGRSEASGRDLRRLATRGRGHARLGRRATT